MARGQQKIQSQQKAAEKAAKLKKQVTTVLQSVETVIEDYRNAEVAKETAFYRR